jgi:ElaB/YqjD/DUF883 family membrane-anchored ribosome-binding protein
MNEESPAAQSFKQEKARNSAFGRDQSQKGLEDTFPASATYSGVAPRRPERSTTSQTAMDFQHGVENRIHHKPFAAIAIAAAVGSVFGITR